MAIPRFRIDPTAIEDERVQIRDVREVHHAVHVLRVGVGDWCVAFTGDGTQYHGRISEIGTGRVTMQIERVEQIAMPVHQLTLLQGLPKTSAFDAVLHHATELGVTAIVPVMTARSVIHVPSGGWSGKVARWQRMVSAAAKQCRRADVPTIHAPVTWHACLAQHVTDGVRLMPTLEVETRPIATILAELSTLNFKLNGIFRVTVCIGPEGDFTREEVQAFVDRGGHVVSLGPRSLRVETAALAALAIIQHELSRQATSDYPTAQKDPENAL